MLLALLGQTHFALGANQPPVNLGFTWMAFHSRPLVFFMEPVRANKSPLEILGFHPGFEVILPFLLEANMRPSGVPSTARRPYGSQTGIGDLVGGPLLQSGMTMLNGRLCSVTNLN
jgi:hypothetical protein